MITKEAKIRKIVKEIIDTDWEKLRVWEYKNWIEIHVLEILDVINKNEKEG